MAESDNLRPHLTGAELRARLLGNSRAHDEDRMRFWQQADEQTHARALYELLALTERIMAAAGPVRQEPARLILKPGRILIQPRA